MRLDCLRRISHFIATLFNMLKLVWQVHPPLFIALLLLELAQGLIPLGSAWLIKALFDLLSRGLQSQALPMVAQPLLFLLVAQVLLSIISQLSTPLNTYVQTDLGRRLTLDVQLQVYQKINSINGLEPFENPQFHDTIQLAAQGARHVPLQSLSVFTTLFRSAVTVTTFLGVLISLSPLLAGVVGLALFPQMYAQLRMGQQRFGLAAENTPKERHAAYYGYVLSGMQFAKDLRLFNLAPFFLRIFAQINQEICSAQRKQHSHELGWEIVLSSLTSLIAGVAFAFVAIQAFAGQLSLGDLTLYTNALGSTQSALAGIIFSLSRLHEGALFYQQFTNLLALTQPLSLTHQTRSVPPLADSLTLHNVSFRYSDKHPWVLRNVNLVIPAHQCVALVGLNGAGKTTLVKLLTRLYDPTEGQILWDGIDIREFNPDDLRTRISTIFQDFTRYDLTAQENIGIGNVEQINNLRSIQQAAMMAGVHTTLNQLPQGYQTLISRWLASNGLGVDLSGGEWQKIAIARLFMRQSPFVILDEPTAALDAQSEYELYHRCADFLSNRTSLLISHRFSTVRMAHIIAVLEDGQITELGKHETLLAKGGTYAKLYRLQAEQYQESSVKQEQESINI